MLQVISQLHACPNSADLGFNAKQKLGLNDIQMRKYDGRHFLSTPILEMSQIAVEFENFISIALLCATQPLYLSPYFSARELPKINILQGLSMISKCEIYNLKSNVMEV